jgi:hypothetical protein
VVDSCKERKNRTNLQACLGGKDMTASGTFQGSVAGAEQGRAQVPATLRVELGPAQAARWLTLATATMIGSCVLVTSLAITLEHRSMFRLAPIFDLNREASIPQAIQRCSC